MKKNKLLISCFIFLLLTLPLTIFLNLFSLTRFSVSLDGYKLLWNANVIFCFELSIISLASIWIISSKIISKRFNIKFEDFLIKDIYTYFPLFLLLFYGYTESQILTLILLITILTLSGILKIAVLLHIKEKKNYAYPLISLVVFLLFVTINYFFYINHPLNTVNKQSVKAEPITSLKNRLKLLYNADPLSLFDHEIKGIYKKKIEINNEIRNALVLLPPRRIEKSLLVPQNSYLQFGVGIWKSSFEGRGNGIQFNAFVKNKNKTEVLHSKYIDPKHYKKDRKWFDVNIDLKDYEGQEISIIFDVSGSPEIQPPFEGKPDNRDDYAAISDPRILSHKSTADTPAANNIILISIDTLRADHLGCYGYSRKNISPNIDAFANNGILFEQAISHSPWTAPSHMSIFTSLLPSYHRVSKGDVRLPEDITTLTEKLRSGGYRTAAFTGGAFINGNLGFCKGFDTYEQSKSELSWVKDDVFTNDKHFGKIIKWLERNRQQKFFLFLHTYEVHAPYTNYTYAREVMNDSEIEKGKSLRNPSVASFKEFLQKNNIYNKKVTETLYDGGIKGVDKYIGILINNLKRLKMLRKTIVILTSDHGEEFCDHSEDAFYDNHSNTLYDELIHVPLIFFIPDTANKLKIKQQVGLVDIMPTILELVKIKYDKNKIQGVSLLPIIEGKKIGKESVVVSETEAGRRNTALKSIRINDGIKYIYTVKKYGRKVLISDNPDKEELYNLTYDSGEKYNLHTREPKLSKVLKNRTNKILEKALSKQGKVTKIKLDKEMKNRIKALGYIQ